MIPGGKLGRWNIAETRVQALVVIALTDEAVEVLLGVFQIEIVLHVDLLGFQGFGMHP